MFKGREKDTRSPEDIKLEQKLERERKAKAFVKQTDKQLAELKQKREQYKTMALEARSQGNKTQMASAIKFIKYADVNINRLTNFKMQIDMGKMMADTQKNTAQFMTTMTTFGESLKDSGINQAELQKSLTKFNMEAEKLQSQSEMMEDLMGDSQEIFNDMFDVDLNISESEVDSILGTGSASSNTDSKDIERDLDSLISKL